MVLEQLKILLVDDEPYWLETLSDILKRWGFGVKTVSSAFEAMKVFVEEEFGLVLTDFEMPQMNGVELTRSLRNLSATIPVILMSGDETAGASYYARQVGVNAYINKSSNPDEIRKCIESVLRKPLSSFKKSRN